MAVQISRKNRKEMDAENLKSASDGELKQLASDYLAYFGQYTIDEENSLINHHIEACPSLNRIGVHSNENMYLLKMVNCH